MCCPRCCRKWNCCAFWIKSGRTSNRFAKFSGTRCFTTAKCEKSHEIGIKAPNLAVVRPIAQKVLDLFNAGEVDVVTLMYSQFKSVVTQIPTTRQLIPASVEAAAPGATRPFYDYEPDENEILAALLPKNITVQLLSALLENQAGFFASQMAAMDNATRNAGDMIKALTIQMNRTRQAQITKELIEIISGASAV
jgi:F-type H+-transporting ATPase subunit gamma